MASANKKLRRKESKMFIEMGGRNQGADGKGERAKGQGESAGVEVQSVRESKTELEFDFLNYFGLASSITVSEREGFVGKDFRGAEFDQGAERLAWRLFSFLRPLKPPSSLIVPKIVIELELELGLKLLRLGELDSDFRTRGILGHSLRENLALPSLDRLVSGKIPLVSWQKIRRLFAKFQQRLAIKCRNGDQKASELSGGNQQKIVFATWLALIRRF